MAGAGNARRRTSSSAKRRSGAKKKTTSRSAAAKDTKRISKERRQADSDLLPLILLFLLFTLLIVLCLCMYGVIGGIFGPWIRDVCVGIFGRLAYILPPLVIAVMVWLISRAFRELPQPATHRMLGFILFWLTLGIFFAFLGKNMKQLEEQLSLTDNFFSHLSTINKELFDSGAARLSSV